MNLLIPVDCNKRHESLLTTLDASTYWAFVELDDGRIVDCKFYEDKNDVEAWIDNIVVINEQEYIWQFLQEKITVLVAPTQRSIDEIVEAFLLNKLKRLTK